MKTVTTPWGKATPLESVTVPQRAGERRFTSQVELLEAGGGERLVRFSYATESATRRGPVTLRERDIAKLAALVRRKAGLAQSLRPLAGDGGENTV